MRRALCLVVVLLCSCGKLRTPTTPDGGGDPIDPTATFTRVQNEIFTPTCAQIGCHDTFGRQEGMLLTAGHAYTNTVGVASMEMGGLLRVRPNDPENSYLYRKVLGSGISGDRMPKGQTPLDAAHIKLIRDWIRRGAPND